MRRAVRICLGPGCRRLVRGGGYCDDCRPARNDREYDRRRGPRLYGAAWRKRRDAHLRANPYCVDCERSGRLVAADEADHIVPHRGDPVLFDGPIQSLCRTCHSLKTRRGL